MERSGNGFNFVEGQDVLDGSEMHRLEKFYLDKANQFAKENGLMSIPTDQKINWAPYWEYKTIDDLHSDLIGHPDLVFHEMWSNARRHGNQGDSSKRISVDAEWNEDEFRIAVTDEGNGFGSSKLKGDGMGMAVIGDFATREIKARKRKSGDGFTVTVTRNLKTQLREILSKFNSDISVDEAWGLDRAKINQIREEIKRTGTLKIELEE